jgi:MFS family permease
MATAVAQERTIPRLALVGIFGGLFAGYLGLTSVIPVLPGFVRNHLGAPDIVVGLAITATSLTALLTRPLAGRLADRRGRKGVMRLGALIVGAGGLLYFAPLGVAGLIGVRLVLGVGEASLFTAGAAWTVSLAPHQRRGQLIGLYGVSMWGGISLGTLCGATLQHAGYPAVWAFSALVPLIGLLLISLVPAPEQPRPPQASQVASAGGASQAGSAGQAGQTGSAGQAGQTGSASKPGATGKPRLLATLLPRPVILPGTALTFGAAGYAGLASFIVLFLKSRGIGSGVLVLSEFSAVYAGTRLFIGHFPDKYGPRLVAAASGAGEAAGLLIIAWSPGLPEALIGGLIMGVGFSLLHPSLALMVMNRTDPSAQGVALGAYTSFWDLGLGVWGPLTGLIAASFGYPAVFLTGAAGAAVASLMALWIDRPATRSAGDLT